MSSAAELAGKHVLITRGGEQGERLAGAVAGSGGIPHVVPLIDFRPYDDPNAAVLMKAVEDYDWIVFTSKNGVDYFFRYAHEHRPGIEAVLSSAKLGVVGEKTGAALERYGLKADFMPSLYTAKDYVDEFFGKGLRAERVLIPKGNLARNTIAEGFRSRNISADEWIIYETVYPSSDRAELIRLLKENILDAAIFTSPSTFNHFMSVAKQHNACKQLDRLTVACIGPVTRETVEKEGLTVQVCPDTYTMDALINDLRQYYQ